MDALFVSHRKDQSTFTFNVLSVFVLSPIRTENRWPLFLNGL